MSRIPNDGQYMKFDIKFSGHKNIRSLHQKTIEITTDDNLTPSGDCIIGVSADCGCNGIPDEIKTKLQDPTSKVKISILVNDESFEVAGSGSSNLSLTHKHDIVLRKSTFVCPRTLAIQCTQGSDAIPRKMIKMLQNPAQKGTFRITIE